MADSDSGAQGGEASLVAALRAGDEAAFAELVDRHYSTMVRVARLHVATREAAEDVVQETFLAVIKGIDRFEERSSLRTWMFRILVNQAKTRGQRDQRVRPFSSLVGPDPGGDEPVVDPDRFLAEGRWAGFWGVPPAAHAVPEARALASEVGERMLAAIDGLPPNQRLVITLRDVKGLPAPEVCGLLGISEANQRVLLHRARSKARACLEDYLDGRMAVS